MRIALAQMNPIVGDIAGNARMAREFIAQARRQGADLVVFPELTIIGYPPKDLLLKPQFIDDSLRTMQTLASEIDGITAMIGCVVRNDQPIGRPLFNAAAIIGDHRIQSLHFKTLLPTYDVFDESRYFEPAPPPRRGKLTQIAGVPVGVSICEDLWNDQSIIQRRLYREDPIAELITAGTRLLLNCSASPFVAGKQEYRLRLFAAQARRAGVPLIVVNQVGGNDELVFDGDSVAFDANGNVIARAKSFEEDLLVVDLDERSTTTAASSIAADELEQIHRALILGLRDYVRKCGFNTVVLGLSGGIDSALTAALAVEALGKERVTGVALPSRFSSEHSLADARQLAENLGIAFHVVPIADVHDCFERTLAPAFAGREPDVTEENLQARIRGAVLMAFSNKFNHLLLTTGNKSEIAVGYCTLYGDMAGGLAVISDVPKTMVYQLCERINARAGRDIIPRSSITKPPSAELRPNQTDQDSLPPYDVLDAILYRYVEEEKGAARIIAEGFDPPTVMRVIKLIDRSEYKRRQAAPGLKVTSRAFGFGRRMPIAQNYIQDLPKHGEPSPVLE